MKYYFDIIKYELILLPQLLRYLFSSKRKALYVGCTGMGNLGDEAVYHAIENLLGESFVFYNVLYSKPSAGKWGRRFFIKRPKYIVLGGGTIIKKGAESGYLKVFNDLHYKYTEAKLLVFGSGVADPILASEVGFPTDFSSWSTMLNKCEFIAVRGILSKSYLESEKWAVKKEINILHDPALFFVNKDLVLKPKTKRIGINFCDIAGRIYGGDAKKVENFANELVSNLLKDNWKIVLYPTVNSDIKHMKSILKQDLLAQVQLYENYTSLESSLTFFDDIDVFVGQRLHSIIFSSITYTPFHAIEYESKTSDYLLTLGLKDYSTRTDSLNLNRVIEKINHLYDNLHDEQNQLFRLSQKASKEQKACALKLIDN